MISMICSRNLTDPNVMKGFYHLITHPPSPTPDLLEPSPCFWRPARPPPTPSCPPLPLPQLRLPACVYLCAA